MYIQFVVDLHVVYDNLMLIPNFLANEIGSNRQVLIDERNNTPTEAEPLLK